MKQQRLRIVLLGAVATLMLGNVALAEGVSGGSSSGGTDSTGTGTDSGTGSSSGGTGSTNGTNTGSGTGTGGTGGTGSGPQSNPNTEEDSLRQEQNSPEPDSDVGGNAPNQEIFDQNQEYPAEPSPPLYPPVTPNR